MSLQPIIEPKMIRQLAISTAIFLSTFNLLVQTINFVKSDTIIYPIHKANIGKIAFMEKSIPIENFTQNDFLNAIELKEKTDLSIRVFLSNSLTNYLHLLSPELSAEELTKNGNYQFTFFIDGKKIFC